MSLSDVKLGPWPYFEQDEIDAVTTVMKSGKVNYWTGDESRQFEKEFAEYSGVKHCIALANGTLALDLALHVFEVGKGDEVVVTSRTFLASASCVVLAGATPVFADVDAESQNITAETIAKVLTPRTKAIILVHLAGWPCEMDPIMELAKKHNIRVIEDCAQSHGAEYKGRKLGSIGDAGAFSFCQDKIMTTGGEGGLLLLHDDDLWKKAWSFKDHGKSYDAVYNKQHPPGFRWLHESFGTNWRITEMQSAIGRVQLRKLDGWMAKRTHNAQILEKAFEDIPAFRLTKVPAHIRHAYYKYYVFLRPEKLKEGWDQQKIMQEVNQQGVPCFSGSCSEVYLEKAFDNCSFRPKERLPVARQLGETSLMFLVHPTLDDRAMEKVVQAVQKVMKEATKS